MSDFNEYGKFWRGRVVIEERHLADNNPGHVIGFASDGNTVYIRVEFANGDRYNVRPYELRVL
jgi:hypothetical protein